MTLRSRLQKLESRGKATNGVHTIVVYNDEDGPEVEEAARYAEANNKLLVIIRNYYAPLPGGMAA